MSTAPITAEKIYTVSEWLELEDEMLVELHSRDSDGRWEQHYFTEPEELIKLSRFELHFPLSDIYDRLKMPLAE